MRIKVETGERTFLGVEDANALTRFHALRNTWGDIDPRPFILETDDGFVLIPDSWMQHAIVTLLHD